MLAFQRKALRTTLPIAKIPISRIMVTYTPFVVSRLTCPREEQGSRQRQMDR